MQDHVLTMFRWEFFSNGIKMTIIDRGLGSNHYLDGHPAQMNSIIDWKVKLGNKERFDKEQIGVNKNTAD